MPVLDSNFLILLAAKEPKALAAFKRLEQGDLLVPWIVAAEYLCKVDDPVAELHALHKSFRVVHSTDESVLEAARLRAQPSTKKAEKPRWPDIHIAALTLLEGTFVVTTNKRHFTQLGVPAWHFQDEADPPKS
jgi:predicted nucleic acid-binding protein